MFSVSQSALELLREEIIDRDHGTSCSDCEYMISICGTLTGQKGWSFELLFLPRDMPSYSLSVIDGVTFHHPGEIDKLDVAISYENEMYLIDGVQVELT